MTLIIETGSIVANANSFISLEDFKAYCALVGNEDYVGLSDAELEAALFRAVNYLENRYRSRWVGTKVTRDQSLTWPRTNASDEDGFLYENNQIPKLIIKAQCEVAIRDLKGVLVIDDKPENRIAKKTEKYVDGLSEESVEYSQPISTKNEVDRIVGPLLHNSSQVRLVRG